MGSSHRSVCLPPYRWQAKAFSYSIIYSTGVVQNALPFENSIHDLKETSLVHGMTDRQNRDNLSYLSKMGPNL